MKIFCKSLLLIFLYAVILSSEVKAQNLPVQGINYQAVARNTTGKELANTNIGVQVTIFSGPLPGTIVLKENHTVVTNQFGLFNLVIGTGSPVAGNLFAIIWESGPHFLEVAIDPLGGNSYTSMGKVQFQTVPYAFAAGVAANGIVGPAGPSGSAGTTGPIGPTGPSGSANINGSDNYLVKFDGPITGATVGENSQVFDDGNKVGIGTNSPLAKLHILSNDSIGLIVDCVGPINGMAVNSTTATGSPGYLYAINGTPVGGHRITTTGDWRLELPSGTPITVTNTGNVGIGTTMPGTELEVNGQVKITGGFPGANKVLTSDSTGLATWQTPVVTPKIAFYCGHNTGPGQTITGSGYSTVILSNGTSVVFNDGNGYDSSSGEFTAPVTGVYQLNVNLLLTNATNINLEYGVELEIGGEVVARSMGIMGAVNRTVNFSTTAKLTSGTTAFIKAISSTGSYIIDSYGSSFSGHLVY